MASRRKPSSATTRCSDRPRSTISPETTRSFWRSRTRSRTAWTSRRCRSAGRRSPDRWIRRSFAAFPREFRAIRWRWRWRTRSQAGMVVVIAAGNDGDGAFELQCADAEQYREPGRCAVGDHGGVDHQLALHGGRRRGPGIGRSFESPEDCRARWATAFPCRRDGCSHARRDRSSVTMAWRAARSRPDRSAAHSC